MFYEKTPLLGGSLLIIFDFSVGVNLKEKLIMKALTRWFTVVNEFEVSIFEWSDGLLSYYPFPFIGNTSSCVSQIALLLQDPCEKLKVGSFIKQPVKYWSSENTGSFIRPIIDHMIERKHIWSNIIYLLDHLDRAEFSLNLLR